MIKGLVLSNLKSYSRSTVSRYLYVMIYAVGHDPIRRNTNRLIRRMSDWQNNLLVWDTIVLVEDTVCCGCWTSSRCINAKPHFLATVITSIDIWFSRFWPIAVERNRNLYLELLCSNHTPFNLQALLENMITTYNYSLPLTPLVKHILLYIRSHQNRYKMANTLSSGKPKHQIIGCTSRCITIASSVCHYFLNS
jgi:hypothetical protein